MSETIAGIGTVPSSTVEYTTGKLKNDYEYQMAIILEIFEKTTPPTQEDADRLMEAMKAIEKMLKEGDMDGNVPVYMTKEMIDKSASVFTILEMAGITVNGFSGDPLVAISTWRSLSDTTLSSGGKSFTIGEVMASSIEISDSSTRTLQSMIETEFIRGTLDDYAVTLSALKEMLEASESGLVNLTTLLNILNSIKVKDADNFVYPPTSNADIPPGSVDAIAEYINNTGSKWNNQRTGDAFRDAYNRGDPNAWKFISEDPAYGAILSKDKGKHYTGIYKVIGDHYQQVNLETGATYEQAKQVLEVKRSLEELILLLEEKGGMSRTETNSPAYMLDQVVKDIDSYFKGVDPNDEIAMKSAVNKWVLDSQNDPTNTAAGRTFANLQNAIASLQSLNESQQDEFRANYETFQQFCKIAASVLETITKLLEKIASKAGQ